MSAPDLERERQFAANRVAAHPRAEAPAPGQPPTRPMRQARKENPFSSGGGGGQSSTGGRNTISQQTNFAPDLSSRTNFASTMGPGKFA